MFSRATESRHRGAKAKGPVKHVGTQRNPLILGGRSTPGKEACRSGGCRGGRDQARSFAGPLSRTGEQWKGSEAPNKTMPPNLNSLLMSQIDVYPS